jgi:probable HAF family extracellular repeat protein
MNSTRFAGIFAALLSLVWMLTFSTSPVIAQQRNEADPKYSVADLGTLGGSFSWEFAVNNKGWVVGIATLAGDMSLHAFLWHGGLMTDLGILGQPETLPVGTASFD